MEYCEEQTEHELTKRELEELQKIAPPCTDTELNILIEETEHAIKKLRNKRPGHDNITAEMIKQGGKH